MSDNFFLSYISDILVNYFLDILYQFIIINDYLPFASYFRQSKILPDIRGRRTFRGPTLVRVGGMHRPVLFLVPNFICSNFLTTMKPNTGANAITMQE